MIPVGAGDRGGENWSLVVELIFGEELDEVSGYAVELGFGLGKSAIERRSDSF